MNKQLDDSRSANLQKTLRLPEIRSNCQTKYYLNLTNGIEFLDHIVPANYGFIRIQSTACEQKRWTFILRELDYDFLMNLALGTQVIVVDFSARKSVPRSVYQGLEWIRFALYKVWFDRTYIPDVRGNRCLPYFEHVYREIEDSYAIKKIEYFRKFLKTEEIRLSAICGRTRHDADYRYYSDCLDTIS